MNRERIQQLIDLFERLPDEKVDMTTVFSDGQHLRTFRSYTTIGAFLDHCGTAACICGWTAALSGTKDKFWDVPDGRDWLGLEWSEARHLFMPYGFNKPGLYTRSDAIETLKHLLETGEVRWPEKVAS